MSSTTSFFPVPPGAYASGVFVPDRSVAFASTSGPQAPASLPSRLHHELRAKAKGAHPKAIKASFKHQAPSPGGTAGRGSLVQPAGGFFGLPDLHQMKQSNKKKTRRHFKGRKHGQTPGSVPHAPHNSNSFLLAASMRSVSPALHAASFHVVTPNPFGKPGSAWKNGYGTLDVDAAELGALAGIDMFGTNAGLITRTAAHESAGAMDEDSDDSLQGGSDQDDGLLGGYELHDAPTDGGGDDASAALRARLAEQAAYVAELEESNLNLQERVFLLHQQLKEAQAAAAAGGASDAGGGGGRRRGGSGRLTSDGEDAGLGGAAATDDETAGGGAGASGERDGGETEVEGDPATDSALRPPQPQQLQHEVEGAGVDGGTLPAGQAPVADVHLGH